MSLVSTTLLAFSMSTDAFAASLCKGTCMQQPRFSVALKTGLVFGVIEMISPVLGWLLGMGASQLVRDWDHWVIFTLLLLLGGRMIFAGLKPQQADDQCCGSSSRNPSWWLIVATAIATSLDAMAVGIGLAFMDVNIWLTALAIGLATTIMSTTGVMIGRRVGAAIGQRAEILGGIILIGVGCATLYHHLAADGLVLIQQMGA
ncbi:manganese efflux pump MntP [Halomonas huangheensis]|uniref:Putative manganese efflux pump MntP n=1 Tax=Halomonas huangheensis TaxID=1178482 RepID=W1N9B3_9GAMM|nr:manganese efflux pump MntP [Halomonas huangheensis]ALM53144.1 hypothetical protein AR456_13275 [Halomonas huangheensis]ERL51505.1 hypothetical protein BJB45_13885 [Halomonas huangheensis]